MFASKKTIVWGVLGLVAALVTAVVTAAPLTEIQGLRLWAGPESSRLVLDISAPVEHKVFVLNNPLRVVIDLKQARMGDRVTTPNAKNSVVKSIRSAAHGDELRIVLDMKQSAKAKSFLLRPHQNYGHRLVLDLDNVTSDRKALKTVKPKPHRQLRPLVVAIDAGHGGDDPGAVGKNGTSEKDVVLSISRRLHDMLNREKGIKAVMVRSDDYYVSLRSRMQKARDKRADLFISIHADAVENGMAEGASVYVLSQKGASSEAARWLASSQNDSDLLGGVSLDDKDELLASVLLDLSQNATIAASTSVGETVLGQLQRVTKLHKDEVENAGFVVLKSPDIPSILVETGFISNPKEESKLRSRHYQHKVALALVKGIKSFFHKNPVAGTYFSRSQVAGGHQMYEIRKGDTLSAIARRYKVDQQRLRQVNQLSNDTLLPGQILRIPQVL
ncbi:MAG: N-acetylmuramoyl-L-alanine amidase [Gammaproteobacteria bacterium]|nr:N-acetylmuramoyl-L-alanine amidase [Gammaproteobacteria bacterium]MDH5800168.1 N-acetylmuramoyl-L-alanine amidase [Gammaproteobacteria bacterium]